MRATPCLLVFLSILTLVDAGRGGLKISIYAKPDILDSVTVKGKPSTGEDEMEMTRSSLENPHAQMISHEDFYIGDICSIRFPDLDEDHGTRLYTITIPGQETMQCHITPRNNGEANWILGWGMKPESADVDIICRNSTESGS